MALVAARTMIAYSGAGVLVRSAMPDDAARVAELAAEMAREGTWGDEDELPDEAELRERLFDYVEAPGSICLVAELDGCVAGFIDVARHTGEISLCVRWRGRGVGGVLMSALLDWTAANPVLARVGLWAQADNQWAIALYRRFGFEVTGRAPGGGRGRFRDSLLMSRAAR
jgi:putative acetyltransferase